MYILQMKTDISVHLLNRYVRELQVIVGDEESQVMVGDEESDSLGCRPNAVTATLRERERENWAYEVFKNILV